MLALPTPKKQMGMESCSSAEYDTWSSSWSEEERSGEDEVGRGTALLLNTQGKDNLARFELLSAAVAQERRDSLGSLGWGGSCDSMDGLLGGGEGEEGLNGEGKRRRRKGKGGAKKDKKKAGKKKRKGKRKSKGKGKKGGGEGESSSGVPPSMRRSRSQVIPVSKLRAALAEAEAEEGDGMEVLSDLESDDAPPPAYDDIPRFPSGRAAKPVSAIPARLDVEIPAGAQRGRRRSIVPAFGWVPCKERLPDGGERDVEIEFDETCVMVYSRDANFVQARRLLQMHKYRKISSFLLNEGANLFMYVVRKSNKETMYTYVTAQASRLHRQAMEKVEEIAAMIIEGRKAEAALKKKKAKAAGPSSSSKTPKSPKALKKKRSKPSFSRSVSHGHANPMPKLEPPPSASPKRVKVRRRRRSRRTSDLADGLQAATAAATTTDDTTPNQ